METTSNTGNENSWRIIEGSTFVCLEETYCAKRSIMDRFSTTKVRSISINIVKGIFITSPNDSASFTIPDEQYTQALKLLRKQCKEAFGFEPQYEYGETNFEKLHNFTKYPFAPQFAAIEKIEDARTYILSTHRTEPDCIEHLFSFLSIPLTPVVRRSFLKYPDTLFTILILHTLGFKDQNIVNDIISTRELYYPTLWEISIPSISVIAPTDRKSKINFELTYSYAKDFCSLILPILSERKTIRLLNSYSNGTDISRDAGSMFVRLYKRNAIPENDLKHIFRDGFTQYNHDLLRRLWQFDLHHVTQNRVEEKNCTMQYTDEEKKLEETINGYSFHLAKDTDQLLDISTHMHNCVGYVYRDKAINHTSIILYAQKDSQYEACIELCPREEGTLKMKQCLAVCNRQVEGLLRDTCIAWGNKYNLDPEECCKEITYYRDTRQILNEQTPETEKEITSFEDIVNITDLTIQRIISTEKMHNLARALYGASDEVKQKFFINMSGTSSETLKQDISFFGPVDEHDNETCRNSILRSLHTWTL